MHGEPIEEVLASLGVVDASISQASKNAKTRSVEQNVTNYETRCGVKEEVALRSLFGDEDDFSRRHAVRSRDKDRMAVGPRQVLRLQRTSTGDADADTESKRLRNTVGDELLHVVSTASSGLYSSRGGAWEAAIRPSDAQMESAVRLVAPPMYSGGAVVGSGDASEHSAAMRLTFYRPPLLRDNKETPLSSETHVCSSDSSFVQWSDEGSVRGTDSFVHYDEAEWAAYCAAAYGEHKDEVNSSFRGERSATKGGRRGRLPIPDRVAVVLLHDEGEWEAETIVKHVAPPFFRVPSRAAAAHGVGAGKQRKVNNGKQDGLLVFTIHLSFDAALVDPLRSAADVAGTLQCLRQHLALWYDEGTLRNLFDASRPLASRGRVGETEVHAVGVDVSTTATVVASDLVTPHAALAEFLSALDGLGDGRLKLLLPAAGGGSDVKNTQTAKNGSSVDQNIDTTTADRWRIVAADTAHTEKRRSDRNSALDGGKKEEKYASMPRIGAVVTTSDEFGSRRAEARSVLRWVSRNLTGAMVMASGGDSSADGARSVSRRVYLRQYSPLKLGENALSERDRSHWERSEDGSNDAAAAAKVRRASEAVVGSQSSRETTPLGAAELANVSQTLLGFRHHKRGLMTHDRILSGGSTEGFVASSASSNPFVLPTTPRPHLWAFMGAVKSDRVEMIRAFAALSRRLEASAAETVDEERRRRVPPRQKEAIIGDGSGGDNDVSVNNGTINNEPPSRLPFRYACCGGDDIEAAYRSAYFVPIGRGFVSLDCFRVYEACASGAVPIVVGPLDELIETFSHFYAATRATDSSSNGGGTVSAPDSSRDKADTADYSPARKKQSGEGSDLLLRAIFAVNGRQRRLDGVVDRAIVRSGGFGRRSSGRTKAALRSLPPFIFARTWSAAAAVVESIVAEQSGDKGLRAVARRQSRVADWFIGVYGRLQHAIVFGDSA